MHKIAVVKLGSSILATEKDIPDAIHEIYHYLRLHYKVLVVVSALGDTTNHLHAQAKSIYPDSPFELQAESLAAFIATGEMASAALFTLALHQAGIPAVKCDYTQLSTSGPWLDANPVHFNTQHILACFKAHSVVVMPGFIGQGDHQGVTLLGRGGSDFTAVYCAVALNAERCVLYKDTHGIYNRDPAIYQQTALPYQNISYHDCLQIPYPVVQHKAIQWAEKNNYSFFVKALHADFATCVSANPSVLSLTQASTRRPLSVILFGLGTVGYGVYQRLRANPAFKVVGIAVRDLEKYAHLDIPCHLISDKLTTILARDADIVLELMGDPLHAEQVITYAITHRRHVVSANKFLMAERGAYLTNLAKEHHVQLRYSAAVAGGIPILEVIDEIKKTEAIQSISAILNGTCNFILDKVSLGSSIQEAVQAARIAGFAEADPTLDVSGLDAAQKATILARHAFGLEPESVHIEGIVELDEMTIRQARQKNKIVKLLARCDYVKKKLTVTVQPQAIDQDHPLAAIQEANNGFLLQTDHRLHFLQGAGAGRWPTTEAVFGDLLSLSLKLAQSDTQPTRLRSVI